MGWITVACGTVTCYETGKDRLGGAERLAPRPRIQQNGSRALVKVVVDPGNRKLSKGGPGEGSTVSRAAHPFVTAIPARLELSPLYKPRKPSRLTMSSTTCAKA